MLSLSAQTEKPTLEYTFPSVEEAPADTFPEEMEPDIKEVISDAEEPQPLNLDEVWKLIGRYPQIAKDAGIQGTVVVRVLVDKEGKYMRHVILRKVHPMLTSVVEKGLPALRFTPAMLHGVPIMYWVNLPFKFRLFE